MIALRLFLRGFLIVACTAANVRLLSRGLYGWAFVTGWAISALWWTNTGKAGDDRRARCPSFSTPRVPPRGQSSGPGSEAGCDVHGGVNMARIMNMARKG
jgi:hypothetical protein